MLNTEKKKTRKNPPSCVFFCPLFPVDVQLVGSCIAVLPWSVWGVGLDLLTRGGCELNVAF